jgi:hypothetical protein
VTLPAAKAIADRGGVVRVGLLGCGHVGSALVRLLDGHAESIQARAGVKIEVAKVAVRNLAKDRDVDLDAARFTHDADEVVADPDIDLVVEVIGGIEPARSLILAALGAGKSVVTANKELLANFGRELFETAEANGVDLLFEPARRCAHHHGDEFLRRAADESNHRAAHEKAAIRSYREFLERVRAAGGYGGSLGRLSGFENCAERADLHAGSRYGGRRNSGQ